MLPFQEDPALARHLAAQQPPPSKRPARRPKPAGIYSGLISSVHQAGYAFLRPDIHHDGIDRDDDLYVGKSHLPKNLTAGDRVHYDIRPARKPGRMEAVNVAKAAA